MDHATLDVRHQSGDRFLLLVRFRATELLLLDAQRMLRIAVGRMPSGYPAPLDRTVHRQQTLPMPRHSEARPAPPRGNGLWALVCSQASCGNVSFEFYTLVLDSLYLFLMFGNR